MRALLREASKQSLLLSPLTNSTKSPPAAAAPRTTVPANNKATIQKAPRIRKRKTNFKRTKKACKFMDLNGSDLMAWAFIKQQVEKTSWDNHRPSGSGFWQDFKGFPISRDAKRWANHFNKVLYKQIHLIPYTKDEVMNICRIVQKEAGGLKESLELKFKVKVTLDDNGRLERWRDRTDYDSDDDMGKTEDDEQGDTDQDETMRMVDEEREYESMDDLSDDSYQHRRVVVDSDLD